MSKTPNADKKLVHARLLLRLLEQESQKVIGKDWLVMEALLSACLGAIASAFYRLENKVGRRAFKPKKNKWLMALKPEDRAFFKKMMGHRGDDVHWTDPKKPRRRRKRSPRTSIRTARSLCKLEHWSRIPTRVALPPLLLVGLLATRAISTITKLLKPAKGFWN